MRAILPLVLLLTLLLSCAHKTNTSKTDTAITEDNPGYYEPELYRKYYDSRYETDPNFEKYYEWKKEE